jgi:VanZ family protein
MPRDLKSFFRFVLPFCVWLAVMLTLNSLPGSALPQWPLPHLDKIVHGSEYALFTVLLFRLFFFVKHTRFGMGGWLALGIAMGYGVLDEVHQIWIPGRSCNLADYLADFTGILLGVAVATLAYRRWRTA